ncbi:MAG: PEP-CTERM sorting domain-containing protein [Bryobacteraceae bacterium]
MALVFSFELLAAPILVDNFNTSQGPLTLTSGGPDDTATSGVGTAGNSIGDGRILYITSTLASPPTADHSVIVNSLSNGLLTFTAGLDDAPEVGLTYDTNTDPLAPPAAFSPTINASGHTTFRIQARADASFTGRLIIFGGGTNSVWDFTIPNTGLGGAFTPVDIDLLAPSIGTGGEISAIDSIFLGLNAETTGGTLELDNLEFAGEPVPEPATYLMMAAGLLLIGFRCKLRQ